MSSPNLTETWYTRANAPFPNTGNTANIANSWVFMLKAFLLGEVQSGSIGGTRPTGSFWTVQGSSNGVSAGYDAVDRWGTQFTASNYVHDVSGSAHSWITLRSPTQMGPVWLTIDLNYAADTSYAQFAFTRTAPFNTGSLIGRPTSLYDWCWAQNTITPNSQINFLADLTTNVTHRGHFSCNVSGNFHFATSRDTTGVFYSYGNCLTAGDREALDQHPTWTGFHQVTSGRGAGQYATLVSPTQTTGRVHNSSSLNSQGGLGSWNFGPYAFAGTVTSDAITGQFRVLPVFVHTMVTSFNAWRGQLPDYWVIGLAPVGSSFPSASLPTHHVVGDMLIPMSVVPII